MDTRTRSGVGVLPDDRDLARLRGDHPGWDIVRAGGQWLATRDRVLFEVEMSYGLRHVLIADTAGQLRDALAEQCELALHHKIELSTSRELAW